jgi:signal transduction histidine kinase
MNVPRKGSSLLWRILLSMSIAVTAVFALTGWMVQRYAVAVSQGSLEEEIRTSLQAYESLWSARVQNLSEISRIMSSMPDVRAAFGTRDQATIRDVAAQLWSRASVGAASFLVLDPTGHTISSLGGATEFSVEPSVILDARNHFPNQVSGYSSYNGHLYYIVLTPVYVQTARDQGLISVLLMAVNIDNDLASELKMSTHGSDFAFVSGNQISASTLKSLSVAALKSGEEVSKGVRRVDLQGNSYLLLGTKLHNTNGQPFGDLFVIRSAADAQSTISALRNRVATLWIAGIVVALLLTYLLARHILEPVKRLDRAAAEVTKQNYDYRVLVETSDELGRLASTFNKMCDSIQKAREDLIHQEQIATIGRLSVSIVHDLRNPLAAIYGGAEMLVDAELSSEQQRRLAANIYSSSRRIGELLQELLDVSQAKTRQVEPCKLSEAVSVARDALTKNANRGAVVIDVQVSENVEVLASRERLERVFVNLFENAIDAMPDGGEISISNWREKNTAVILVGDSGPGIPEEIWPNLFRPFASYGKKNGLGLGLAFSRQAILDAGGDLWVERKVNRGARFLMRLLLAEDSLLTEKPSAKQI